MTTPAVTVVDYGVGNLLSVRRAFEHCGGRVELSGDPRRVVDADRLVLPGVGAFGDCVAQLRARGLMEAVRGFVASGRPLLGICVGMQMLLDESEEFGRHSGFGFIPGKVLPIPRTAADGSRHKIPHIGWTPLEAPKGHGREVWRGTALEDLAPDEAVYFVHSYTATPSKPEHRLADCSYDGCRIPAAVRLDNITGTQFHPEKSGKVGLAILNRFLRL